MNEFLFHFFLEEEGVDEFGDDVLIFITEFADAVELVDECFIADVFRIKGIAERFKGWKRIVSTCREGSFTYLPPAGATSGS